MKKSSGTLVCPWPECIFRSLLQFLVVIARRFSQKLQAHRLDDKEGKTGLRHPRTIWWIWARDVTPTSRMSSDPIPCSQQRSISMFQWTAIHLAEWRSGSVPGPCLNCYCDMTLSQEWERSFHWKLRCHWLEFLWQRQIAVVRQGPALPCERPGFVPPMRLREIKSRAATVPCEGRTTGAPRVWWSCEWHGRCFVD